MATEDDEHDQRAARAAAFEPVVGTAVDLDQFAEPRTALAQLEHAFRTALRDDATSRLTALPFAPVESGKAYLAALREQILVHGRPLAIYSDRHGIFRMNAKDGAEW